MLDGFIKLSLVGQCGTKIIVCLGLIRFEFKCPPVILNGFIQFPFPGQRTPRLLRESAESG